MHVKMLAHATVVVVAGLYALTAKAAPTEEATVKGLKDLVLDPEGFVHVAEDGIARSYAPNGTVIDYAPMSNAQLTNMVNNLYLTPNEREHLAETFVSVNGFAVKDHHQIFHPSTQLRPAIDPARTHWEEDTDSKEAGNSEAALEVSDTSIAKGVHCLKHPPPPKPCTGKSCRNNAECAERDCPGDSCFHAGQHFFDKVCHDLWVQGPC